MTDQPQIRVVVVDDHPIVRDGIRQVLATQRDIDVVGEAFKFHNRTFEKSELIIFLRPWVITNPGTEDALCRHPGLGAMRACRAGRVRSIETALLTDPLDCADANPACRFSRRHDHAR